MIIINNESDIHELFRKPDSTLKQIHSVGGVDCSGGFHWVNEVLEYLFDNNGIDSDDSQYLKRRQFALEQGMSIELIELYATGSIYTSQNISRFRARRGSWKPGQY